MNKKGIHLFFSIAKFYTIILSRMEFQGNQASLEGVGGGVLITPHGYDQGYKRYNTFRDRGLHSL